MEEPATFQDIILNVQFIISASSVGFVRVNLDGINILNGK